MEAETKVPVTEPAHPLTDAIAILGARLDQLIQMTEESVHLQRVGLLEQGHILRFHGPDGTPVALSLPDAAADFVQRTIVRSRNFFEARLLTMVQELGLVGPTSTVCDVGANIGNHSVYFAKIMGAARVLAFEPQFHCFDILSKNISLNNLNERVTAFNCMLGSTDGSGRLMEFRARNLGATRFREDEAGGVKMFALDGILTDEDRAHLDFIKIDVEGMQLEVLAGARSILADRHPAIWVEIFENDSTRAETEALLSELGYTGIRMSPDNWLYR